MGGNHMLHQAAAAATTCSVAIITHLVWYTRGSDAAGSDEENDGVESVGQRVLWGHGRGQEA